MEAFFNTYLHIQILSYIYHKSPATITGNKPHILHRSVHEKCTVMVEIELKEALDTLRKALEPQVKKKYAN